MRRQPAPRHHSVPAPSFRPRPPPSFRRRPESRTPVCSELRKGRGVDSRFRGNDGTGRELREWGAAGSRQQKSSPSGRGLGEGETQCAANRLPAINRPHRHSGAGRNPEPRSVPNCGKAGAWIPAFAGMTVGAGITGMGSGGPPPKSPLPAGEGWVREKRNAPPTGSPPSIAPTVIPAQAGIQNPGLSRTAERSGCGFPLSRE